MTTYRDAGVDIDAQDEALARVKERVRATFTDGVLSDVGLFGGLFKSIVYGSLVALAGCQQGMACGNSALAVGQSTTKAVVMGIVLIVVSAAVLTVIYINLGI